MTLCHGGEYKLLRLGYDSIPEGKTRHAWFLPINRLTHTGFPIEKEPNEVKSDISGTPPGLLSKTDCIMVINGCKGRQGSKIIEYVKNGGGAVVYGKASNELKSILPVKLLNDYPVSIKDINDTGYKLIFADNKSILTELWQQNQSGLIIPHRGSIIKVAAKPEGKVLAYFVDQEGKRFPALVTGSYGKGRVVYFAGSLDRTQKNPIDNAYIAKVYPLNTAWNIHPLWDPVQLIWIAYASQRSDIVKLVMDYQKYLYLRDSLFRKSSALLETNNLLRLNNKKQADIELAVAKKALWMTPKADEYADRYDMVAAINFIKTALSSLPAPRRKIVKGPAARKPGGKEFWLAGSMADVIFLRGAFNNSFLESYYRKYKKDLDFDGDAVRSGTLFTTFFDSSSARKAKLKQQMTIEDFKFKQSINLSGFKANNLKAVITMMRQHSFKKLKLGTNPNCFAPEYDYINTAGYQALGKYCEETPLIAAVEYLNEPTVYDNDSEFHRWLKNKYGSLNELNSKFGLNYKKWQDIPSWKKIKNNITQKANKEQGRLLTSDNGIKWQICPKKGIKDIEGLQNAKWVPISIPGYFEKVIGKVDGTFWYKAEIPLALGDKIYFQGIDDNAEVYINGKLIKSNTGHNVPFVAYVPFSVVNNNGKGTIHVKVTDTGGNGGIYRNVFIVSENNTEPIKLSTPDKIDPFRILWGLYHEFVGNYPIIECKKFISDLRKTTSKPMVDRSRGATFSSYVDMPETSKICDIFGPHVTSSLGFDYTEGLTHAKKNIISEYYFIAYGERDPLTSKVPSIGRFSGAFYRKHPRAEFLAAGKARNLFWEAVARGFDGIECFVPVPFRWHWGRITVSKKSMMGMYWSFYSTRFEPRIPIKITASAASVYKNIYPFVRDSKPNHKIFILVSKASIGQSQIGTVNDLHPLKANARALYKLLVQDIKQQTGFVDVDKFADSFTRGSQSGKILFIIKGIYLEAEAIEAINKFMNNGGVVISFGPVGIYDAYGRWINKTSSKVTGAKELFCVAKTNIVLNGEKYEYSKPCYLFKPFSSAKNIISAYAGKSKYSFAYKIVHGKGYYYQFGLEPQQIKSNEGYDNVDEALLKNKWTTPDAKLQRYVMHLLKGILKEHKSTQKYYSDSKYAKLLIRKKEGNTLLFIFNMDLLNPRTITVTFPGFKDVEVLYDKGISKLRESDSWSGSLSPGGCRILRLK